MKLTQADIEATGSYELADDPDGSHWFTGYIPSPLFGSTVKVHISLIAGLKTISEKQVQIVNDFSALGPDSIPHIKTKLFEHWLYCEDAYEPGEFDIKTEDDAYANAKFEELLIWTTDMFKGRGANLCFEVEWEYEHGTSIVLWNGELKDAHDVQDYFCDYEPISLRERPEFEGEGYERVLTTVKLEDGTAVDAYVCRLSEMMGRAAQQAAARWRV